MLNHRQDEDELDLSDMIDEYEEDQELRKKIDAMKQAHNHIPQETKGENEKAVVPNTTNHTQPNSLNNIAENTAEDYHHQDDEIFASDVPDDNMKTRVVMDQPLREESFMAEKDASDGSVYMYENREMVEEEITDDDIKEFLGEDHNENEPEDGKIDSTKMNKIITYAIAGIVALCLLIGVGFGVKAMLDHNGSDDKVVDQDKDKDKDKDKDTDNDKDKDQPVTNIDGSGSDKDNDNKPDNSKEIAEIKGMISAYYGQIDDLNQKIDVARKNLRDQMNTPEYKDYTNKELEITTLTDTIDSLNREINQCEENIASNNGTCSDVELNGLKNERAKLTSQKELLESERDNLKQEVDKAREQEANKIEALNKEVTKLNDEITRLNKELQSLSQ